jgi:hypothetical protein
MASVHGVPDDDGFAHELAPVGGSPAPRVLIVDPPFEVDQMASEWDCRRCKHCTDSVLDGDEGMDVGLPAGYRVTACGKLATDLQKRADETVARWPGCTDEDVYLREVHGRDLKVSLGGEVWLYGYACPTHGLRYYRVGDGGLRCYGIADMVQLDPDVPVCPQCLSPLGAALPAGDVCNEMLVPAQAMVELRRLADALRGGG